MMWKSLLAHEYLATKGTETDVTFGVRLRITVIIPFWKNMGLGLSSPFLFSVIMILYFNSDSKISEHITD